MSTTIEAATVTKSAELAPIVSLTDNAITKVKAYLAADATLVGKVLRMYVQEGGCSGMEYGFGFDDRKATDTVTRVGELEVVIDPDSAKMLQGSVVDYVESIEGEGFSVSNPNATKSCGCGHSFA